MVRVLGEKEFRYKVWYDDGSSWEFSAEREWNLLPKYGVLLVKGPTDSEEMVVHRCQDYYWMEGGMVMSCSRYDLDRYLERDCGLSSVKFGRFGTARVFRRVWRDCERWGESNG